MLRWPPPGLERMQGDLGRVAARGALAGGLLVLPLLFEIAREQGFATLGPFADAWWVTLVLSSVGLAFAVDTLARTSRILRRTGEALARGYDLATVWRVVADTERDMGFLLQGARHFVAMDERERQAIALIRVFTMTLHALAGVWLVLALVVGLLASARGALTPTGLWMVTLLPASMAYLVGGVGRLIQDARVRRARRAYHVQPWSADLAGEEIEAWHAQHAALVKGRVPRSATRRPLGATLGRVGWAVAVIAVLATIPLLTLLSASVLGPVLSTLVTPRFDRAREQAARAEGMRPYAAPVDPSVSPQEAGRLLHDLTHVGVEGAVTAGEREPSRRVVRPWLPEVGREAVGIDPAFWPDSLIPLVGAGTTGAQRAYLAEVASHPSSPDFSRLASAGALDVASARWESPFPAGVTVATIPMPRFDALRAAARAHVGSAAYELALGRPDRAEGLLAEVVSVGLLLGDHGPTLVDNLIGFSLVEAGARALDGLYEATGRTDALAELRGLRGAAERAATRVRVEGSEGSEHWVRSLPEMVLDSAAVRGLRWEYFLGVTSLAPCLNLHRIVFGPDQEYEAFLARARQGLVRWPSEEGLFALAEAGWLGAVRSDGQTWVGRLLGLTMRKGEGACGDVIRRIEMTQALY